MNAFVRSHLVKVQGGRMHVNQISALHGAIAKDPHKIVLVLARVPAPSNISVKTAVISATRVS